MKKGLLAILCILTVLSMVHGGGQQENSADDTITLKWQVWITPNLDRVFYNEIAAAFEAEHPGVDVEIIETSATSAGNASDFIRNRIAAGDVPDVMSNISDIPAFADAGHLWELPAADEDLQKVRNLMAASYKGKLYSFASSLQPQSIMFYNKTLWAEAGLSDEDIPLTWDELNRVCERIKAAGLTPIATGGEWVPVVFWDFFVGPQLSKEYPDLWAQIYSGSKKWNDPEIVEILEFMDGLVKNDYIIEGALSIGYAQLEQAFLAGKSVMYPMGSWFTAAEADAEKDWECGAFAVPTKDGKINLTRSGGYGNGFVVSSASENPELAFELVKMVALDPVYGARFIEVDGLFSNLEPALEYSMSPLQKELARLVSDADYSYPILQHALGEPAPPGIGDYFTSGAEAILSQSYTSLDQILQNIDDFIEETR